MRESDMSRLKGKAAGRGRWWLFFAWIALTIVVALYVGIAGPFAAYFGEDLWMIGVVVPPLMIVMLGLGLGWLIWLTTARGPRR